ncbi:MAG: TMEM175 family protein [Acidimicrobiia bacterium]|nr:TMEM175 family protein [Acidimicrobiia bacterium]
MNERSAEARDRQADPDRVKAFTDGVFAIIITILVLEIGVPSDLSDQSLREALDEYHDQAIALHIYGIVLIAVSVARIVFYRHVAVRPQLLWEPLSDKARRLGLLLSAFPIVVYLIAMLLAPVPPTASLVLYFALPLLYFVLVTVLRDRPATEEEAESYS